MPKKRFSEELRIAEPCGESWNEMTGNDRLRFCSHCEKHVNNLSEMTRREALRVVRRSSGNICVRYAVDPKKQEPIFAPRFHQISRRAPVLAAGVIGATVGLTSIAYAQGGPVGPRRETDRNAAESPAVRAENRAGGTVSGTVVDPAGAVIPSRAVSIRNEVTGMQRSMTTDAGGRYVFVDLPDGRYTLSAASGGGFSGASISDLDVASGTAVENFIELPVMERIVLTGVVAISPRAEYSQPLRRAIDDEELDEAKALLARGADPNEREHDGTTAIFSAVESGDIEAVRLLLLYGADVNARDDEGETPLMQIDEDTSPEMVRALIDAGAKVNRTAKNGSTALHRAAAEGKPEVVKILIDEGSEINARDDEGWTPLMRAAYDDDLEKVRMLLVAGAEVNARNNDGETAWDQTAEEEIEDLLVAWGAEVPDEEPDTGETEEPDSSGDR